MSDMKKSYFTAKPPRVFGHRGAAGEAPENTMVSFERAIACGVDVLELDVHATSDGRIAVIHDPTLQRTTNGSGLIREHAWAEVARLDAGHNFTPDGRSFPFRAAGVQVPLLEEVLGRFAGECFNIEVKQADPPIAARVVDMVCACACAERVLLAAEDDGIMQQIRSAAGGEIATGFSAGEAADFVYRLTSEQWGDYQPQGRALQIPTAFEGIELVNPRSIAAAHRLGLEMHVWTINDRAEMDRLLALGVDGIMSDLPALARAAVDEYRRRGAGG